MESIGKIAIKALKEARSQTTATNGTISIQNADGTKTIIGELAGQDSTSTVRGIAQWVGDTTPPGIPTGIAATSKNGIVVVSWDGTLEGGIPADFDHINVFVDGSKIGELKAHGTLATETYLAGSKVTVTASSVDSARSESGALSPNESEKCAGIEITVTDESAGKSVNYVSDTMPTPPYSVGDTWTDVDDGKVYVCVNARDDGEIAQASDWAVAAKAGADATLVCVVSKNGESFKNDEVSTTLDVTIFHGSASVTTSAGLVSEFGASAFLRWWSRPRGATDYSELSSTDPRISNGGFTLTVTPEDVDQQIVFRCTLDDGK